MDSLRIRSAFRFGDHTRGVKHFLASAWTFFLPPFHTQYHGSSGTIAGTRSLLLSVQTAHALPAHVDRCWRCLDFFALLTLLVGYGRAGSVLCPLMGCLAGFYTTKPSTNC